MSDRRIVRRSLVPQDKVAAVVVVVVVMVKRSVELVVYITD